MKRARRKRLKEAKKLRKTLSQLRHIFGEPMGINFKLDPNFKWDLLRWMSFQRQKDSGLS